jgi:hypothetical protein
MAAVEERIVVFGFDQGRIKRRIEIGVRSERVWCCRKRVLVVLEVCWEQRLAFCMYELLIEIFVRYGRV